MDKTGTQQRSAPYCQPARCAACQRVTSSVMRDKYIFDIPVYRKSPSEFDAEINTAVARRVEHIVSYDPERHQLDRETHQRLHHAVIAESGGPWQFNQIVGWLRLFVEGGGIGGHPWGVDAKRQSSGKGHRRRYINTNS